MGVSENMGPDLDTEWLGGRIRSLPKIWDPCFN